MKSILATLVLAAHCAAIPLLSQEPAPGPDGQDRGNTKTETPSAEEKDVETPSGEIRIVVEEEKKEDDSVGVQVGRKLSEIITEVEKRIPQAVEKRRDFFAEGIKGFLEEISPELDYLPDESAIPPSGKTGDIEFLKPVIIHEQKILYIRIDGFTERNFVRLKEELVDISRFKNQPVGAILDLRSAAGENGLVAGEYASLFFDGEAVSFTKNSIKAVLKLPMMLLVGGRTSGDGEIFTCLLRRSGRALVVGEKTAGMPFARLPVKLESGGILLVPDIPAGLEWIKSAPIEPGIAVNPYPQIEYLKISGEKSSEMSDEAVRRVCDLLVSIEALHKDKGTGGKP